MTAPAMPKWQLVLYTPDADGEMVAVGHVVGWIDFKPFDVTPETLPMVLTRYWGPTVGQFASMLRAHAARDLEEAQS